MNSEQERLVSTLVAHSAGAPFLFQPDKYRKGSGTREPADLAWVGNGCVVLFYMQQTAASRDVAIEHNLVQAKGWLRAWRGGHLLTGTNSYRSFSVAYDAYRSILVMSVVDCPDGTMMYHADQCVELSVSRCATITQTALHMLAQAGASMFDIISIVDGLRKNKSDIAPAEVVAIIGQYESVARAYAIPNLRYPEAQCAEAVEYATRYVLGTRAPHLVGDAKDWSFVEMFNDMALAEYLTIVFWLGSAIHQFDQLRSGGKQFGLLSDMEFSRMEVVLRLGPPEALRELMATRPQKSS